MSENPDLSPVSIKDAKRRLPHLDLIENDDVRSDTAILTTKAPSYFWTTPASTSGYHPEVARGNRGLWAHTLMVAQAVEELLWTYEERGFVIHDEADYARAAALLHDQRKYGPGAEPADSSLSNHDLLMAKVIRGHSELPGRVADAVAAHMGPGYDGPEPEPGTVCELVHMADMVASRPQWTPEIHGPVPEELAEIGVTEVDDGGE